MREKLYNIIKLAYVHKVNGMIEKELGGRYQRVGVRCKPTQKPRDTPHD